MNIQAEIKRVCILSSYLDLLGQNERAIEVCTKTLHHVQPGDFGGLYDFYSDRFRRQMRLKTWLETRYKKYLTA